METSPVRVLVVEDYEPFQRFVCSMLGKRPDLQVICEASDGLEAIQKVEELQPDLIVLAVGLPTLNGLISRIAQRPIPQPSPTRGKPAEQLKPPADESKRVLVELVIPCSLKILKWQVAVEKGTKAVISVNFTACGEPTINNLRTNLGC